MADHLELPDPDLRALVDGAVVVAFVPRHAVDLNDELELVPAGSRPADQLSSDHAGLGQMEAPTGEYVGLVVGLQPAASLAGPTGSQHHILQTVPAGDAVILRVFSADGPILTDDEFEAHRVAVEAVFG